MIDNLKFYEFLPHTNRNFKIFFFFTQGTAGVNPIEFFLINLVN